MEAVLAFTIEGGTAVFEAELHTDDGVELVSMSAMEVPDHA
jgi:hypothetical protein